MGHRIAPVVAALSLLWSAVALGAIESTPPAAPSIERPAALSGYGYTVIGRVFLDEAGNVSYLRLLNLSGSTATVSVTLIGSPSGRNYGTTQISIANHAARQIPVTELLSAVGLLGPISPDTRIGLYTRSDSAPVTVQHVLYSQSTGFFENMSTCQNSSVSDTNAALMNVHTTSITDYVSYVTIYNYTTSAVSYDVQVYEAASGTLKGLVTVSVDPNSTFEQPFSWFQDQVQWSPSPTEYHANVVALPTSGSRGALIFHTVYNSRVGVFLNLTNFCTVESTVSTLPVANNDSLSGAQVGQSFAIPFTTLASNDQNTSGASLLDVTTPLTNGTENGTLAQSGSDLTFTAARAGIATFQYRIRTSAGNSGYATVTVNVSDGAPVTDGDRLTQSFAVGSASTIPLSTLLANDHNTSGATLIVATPPSTEGSANGTLTVGSDSLSYTPSRAGTVTFTYQLRNSIGLSNVATVTLTVGGSSTAPVAVSDSLSQTFTVGQTTTVAINVLTANDQNATGATLESVSTPTTDGTGNGTIIRVDSGFAYTPSRTGRATFTYQIRTSAGLSNIATVALTVSGPSDAPVAVSDSLGQTFTVGQTTTVSVAVLTANDRNATGATLDNVTTPTTDGAANGTIIRVDSGFGYTPARTGTATFTYQIRTSAGLSNPATVTLTVSGASAGAPVAVNDRLTQTFTVGQTTTILVSTLTGNDQNATDATFASITTPATDGTANGSFTTVKGGLAYTPARAGTATFTYQLRNTSGLSNVATVTLTVGGSSTAPVAADDRLTQAFTVGQTTTVALSVLTANDQNTTGASLENVTTPTTDGAANGTILRTDGGFGYTPARSGTATFTYQIRTSAGLSNAATVTMIVSASSSGSTGGSSTLPVAVSDSLSQIFTVGQTTTVAVNVLTANDQNATGATLDNLTTPTTDGAANGTIIRVDSGFGYTPARTGVATFTYQIRTSAGLSNTATVVVTVRGAS